MVNGAGVRAGGWERWRLQGGELVSQRPTATNLREAPKSEHPCSFHPLPNVLFCFFFNPFLLFVYLLSVAAPHFLASSHVDFALFFEDAHNIPQSVQESAISELPLQGQTVVRMHLISFEVKTTTSLLTCSIFTQVNTFKQAAKNCSGQQCSIFGPVIRTLKVIDMNAWLRPNNLKLDTN